MHSFFTPCKQPLWGSILSITCNPLPWPLSHLQIITSSQYPYSWVLENRLVERVDCAVKYDLPEKEIAISLINFTLPYCASIDVYHNAFYSYLQRWQKYTDCSVVKQSKQFFLSDAREGKTYMIIFSDSSKLFYNHKCVFVCKQLWATYIDVIELLHSPWTVELLEIFGSSAECWVNGT